MTNHPDDNSGHSIRVPFPFADELEAAAERMAVLVDRLAAPQVSKRTIPLQRRNGEVVALALVDDDDYESLAKHKWMAKKGRGGDIYACRPVKLDGRRATVYMARQILGLEHGDPLEGDHINHDTLDNRRSNLRVVTRSGNQQNRRRAVRGKSAHRGVTFQRGFWRARVKLNGVWHYGGYFRDELAAARAAATLRVQLFPFSEEAAKATDYHPPTYRNHAEEIDAVVKGIHPNLRGTV